VKNKLLFRCSCTSHHVFIWLCHPNLDATWISEADFLALDLEVRDSYPQTNSPCSSSS
jgi:hypothetical protein